MLNRHRFKVLSGIVLSSVVLISCSKNNNASLGNNNEAPHKLVIGFQKSNLNAITLKSEETLLKKHLPNVHIEWKEFPAGPQLLEALSTGSVDLGSVGNTPPLFAQAGNKDLRYVAYEQSHPKTQAMIIKSDNHQIKTLSDLKGKRIALQRGSSAHDLLDKILQKAQLQWSDIQPIWLPPADARAAFEKQTVDAWVTWEPFLSVALENNHAKVFTNLQPFGQSYSFIMGNPDFIDKHPKTAQKFIHATNDAAHWIIKNPEKTLTLYSTAIGLNKDITQKVINNRFQPSLLKPITPNVIEAQQKIADRFAQEKLIPQHIKVENMVSHVIS